MGIVIYSNYKKDVWVHLKEVNVISDDLDESLNSTSSDWYQKNLHPGSMSVSWNEWSKIHSILFECNIDDNITFYRDSVGFIPTHILCGIINSDLYKSTYGKFKTDLTEQLEVENLYESQEEDDDHWDQPDYQLIRDNERMLEILDYIESLVKEGIYYS